MRRDHRLSRMLHVLIHMGDQDGPLSSTVIGQMLGTPAPMVRRTMGALRTQGLVASISGKGGGWTLQWPLADITMLDIYEALEAPALFAHGPANENPTCLVERAVDARLGEAFAAAADRLREDLASTTLAEIAADYRTALIGVGVEARNRADE
ncbi:MAG: Rrf2 family transcriptional regulator [Pseudomonadota bacterium]